MKIWFKDYELNKVKSFSEVAMLKTVGVEITEMLEDGLCGKMPVDDRTKQPAGILHGGASCVLAESLGSIASNLCIDSEKFMAVGLEINANHLRPVSHGYVYGTAQIIHLGRQTHVWDIRIKNEEGKLTCISRLTMAVVPRTPTA